MPYEPPDGGIGIFQVPAHSLTNLQTWQLLDYQQDAVYGASVNRAYKELLQDKKSHTVIVAVIDGVGITQEDLQNKIWTNKKEIPNNGIDDDKNGYVDDVHGWNFLGKKDGRMIYQTNSEADREYARLLPKFIQTKGTLNERKNKDHQYFLKVNKQHLEDSKLENSITERLTVNPLVLKHYQTVSNADSLFEKLLKKQHIYFDDINSFESADANVDTVKKKLLALYTLLPQFKSRPLDSMKGVYRNFFERVKTQK